MPHTRESAQTQRWLAVFFFAYFAFMGLFSPFFGLYLDHVGQTALQIGILTSLPQVLRIVGPPFWGQLATRSGAPVQLLRGLTLAALLASFPLWVSTTFWTLAVWVVVMQLFISGVVPVADTVTIRAVAGDFTRYGRVRVWGSIGFVFMVVGAGWAFERYGLAAFMSVLTVTLLCTALATLRIPLTLQAPAQTAITSDSRPISGAGRGLFLASVFLMILAHASLYGFFSLYLSRLGYSGTVIGVVWAIGVVAEILFFYWQGPVFARHGLRLIMTATFVLGALRFMGVAALADVFWILLLLQVLHAFSFAAHHSASMAALQRWYPGNRLARGQGIYTSVGYGVGGSLGALGSGLMWEYISPESVFWASAAACALGAWCAWLALRPAPAADRAEAP
jgi:PPP family 3-phenylpropionic acid transporter